MKRNFNNVNPTKLHNEFTAQGLSPILFEYDDEVGGVAEKVSVTFDSSENEVLINQIVAEHDPAPLPIPMPHNERLEELEQMVNILLLGGI